MLYVVLTLLLLLVVVVISLRAALQTARKAAARMRLQIQRMPVACIAVSRDLMVTCWNPAAERIFGYAETEMLGRSATLLLPKMLGGELEEVWQRLLGGDATAHSVNENRVKDGRTILCRWTNTPLVESDGSVSGVLVVAEDITELRQAEAWHRELLDQLPYYVFTVDTEDRYTAVNTAACRYFEREREEILGRTAVELGVPSAIAREWTDQNAKTRESGESQTSDVIVSTPAGTQSFRAITVPVHDLNGAIIGVTGVGIETTDLRAAEAAADRLLRAVEQLDEVVFTTDRDGRITYANPAFERVYGYSREEVLGQTPRILKSGLFTREFYTAFWAELLAGRSHRLEYKNRRSDGSLVDIVSTASPLFDDYGNMTGFIAVQQDISQQNRAAEEKRKFEERVEHMARLESLGTLAGGMAHDFNNILSIILSQTSLIEKKKGDPEVLARVVGTVQQAVRRGATLTRQILTFARRTEIRAERVNLTQLIHELRSMISATFPRTVELEVDVAPDLPPLYGDAGQIHQALLNLCVNARDAMPAGGRLSIEARLMPAAAMSLQFPAAAKEDCIEIAVRDTGTGIDEETRKRMFEPFFTTKERGKGTGLGLAMVYGVVNNHGGVLDVESRVGEGTTFRIYLPVSASASAEAPAPERRESRIRGGETLLLIDDEPAILEALGDQLRNHGYQVNTAGSGLEAIAKCRLGEVAPDAVVMDLGMPHMSPGHLLRELHSIAPTIPIVAMTGYVEPDVYAEVVEAGVQKILPKPFEIGELLSVLREVL